MTTPGPHIVASREGREARKIGKPRISPYANIPMLIAFHQPWLDGWDAMDEIMNPVMESIIFNLKEKEK